MTDDRVRVSSICSECGAFLQYDLGATHVQCSYCEASLAVADQGLVRLECPGCRGNFYYIDGAMCGKCPYCGASLLALTNERLLRYIVPPATEAPAPGARLHLLPFWRMTGLAYCWDVGAHLTDGKSFRGIVVKRLVPDASSIALGITNLRLRTSVHPMEPFTPEHESLGHVLPIALDVSVARERLFDAVLNLDVAPEGTARLECQRFDLILEALAVVYYPFWILNTEPKPLAWDGVNGDEEPVFPTQLGDARGSQPVFDQLQLVELTCGNCRAPLPAGSHSVVFPCTNCWACWVAGKQGLDAFNASFARPRYQGEPTLWLPFWQVSAEVSLSGQTAANVAEMVEQLAIRRTVDQGSEGPLDAPLCYFAPAYGSLRGPRLDVAALDLTTLQPTLERSDSGSGKVISCFNGPEDARRMAYTTWINLIPSVRRLKTLRVQATTVRLWYVPFEERGLDLQNLLTGATYNRQVLRGVY